MAANNIYKLLDMLEHVVIDSGIKIPLTPLALRSCLLLLFPVKHRLL